MDFLTILTFLIILILLFIFFVHTTTGIPSYRVLKMTRNFPGPKNFPILGVAVEIGQLSDEELLYYLLDQKKNSPDRFMIWLLGLPVFFIMDANDLEVAMSSVLHITKGYEYNIFNNWLNEGLLTSTGEKWHKRRKMLTPTFHFKILEESMSIFNKNAVTLAEKLLAASEDESGIPINKFVTLCTLDVICESALGISIDSQNNEGKSYVKALRSLSSILVYRITRLWLYPDFIFYSLPIGWKLTKDLKIVQNFTYNIIKERKANFVVNGKTQSKNRRAFLDSLIEYEHYNPGSLTDSDIREEVDTFTFEGHDTTSTAIMFTLYLIGLHQEVQKKCFDELEEIFGDDNRAVTISDLSKMVYLEKVIKESLRIYPSVPYMSRTLTNDLVLKDGMVVPKGVNLVVAPFLIHRNEKYFPNPEEFDPDRFSEDEVAKRNPFSYIPFSAGPRNCIGQKFAMMELKTIVATIIRRTHLETVTKPDDIKLKILLILKPHIPLRIKFTRH